MSNNKKVLGENTKKNKAWTGKKTVASIILGLAALALLIFAIISIVLELGPIKPIKSSKQDATVVGEYAGFDVKYEAIRYLSVLYKQQLDLEMGNFEALSESQKTEYEERLKTDVIESIENTYVVFALCTEFGIDINSDKTDDYVDISIENLIKNELGGSKKNHKKWLTENNLTDSFLRLIYRVDFLEGELIDFLVDKNIIEFDNLDKSAFVDFVMSTSNYARTMHCYYPKASDYFDTSDSKQKAESLSSSLLVEADFEERERLLRSAIGKAPFVSGISMTSSGIYFTYGQMGKAYEEATFALEEYGVSSAFEADGGYYVIMRLPLERDYVAENAGDLLNKYRYSVLKKKLDEKREEEEFAPNDYFESIILAEIE